MTISKICSIFPSMDAPVYSSEEAWYEETDEEDIDEYEDTYYKENTSTTNTNRNNSNKSLPQPSQNMLQPLTLEINPVSMPEDVSVAFIVCSFFLECVGASKR